MIPSLSCWRALTCNGSADGCPASCLLRTVPPNTLDAASFGPFSLSVSCLFLSASHYFLLPNSPEGNMLLRVREGAPQGWAALVVTAESSVRGKIREEKLVCEREAP